MSENRDLVSRAKEQKILAAVYGVTGTIMMVMPFILHYRSVAASIIIFCLGLANGLLAVARWNSAQRALFYQKATEELFAGNAKLQKLREDAERTQRIFDIQEKMLTEAIQELGEQVDSRDALKILEATAKYCTTVLWLDHIICVSYDRPLDLLDRLSHAGNGKAYMNLVKEQFDERHKTKSPFIFHSMVAECLTDMPQEKFAVFRDACRETVEKLIKMGEQPCQKNS